jgi:myo-inositol-1-phosphate synthase
MEQRVGLWIVGAQGGVATTVAVGLALLQQGRTSHWGLVSELPDFRQLPFLNWDQIVMGGYEIRQTRSLDAARQLAENNGAIRGDLLQHCGDYLEQLDTRIRPGILFNAGPTIRGLASESFVKSFETPREAIGRIQADLQEFVNQHQLTNVVMVNLASTEPPFDRSLIPARWEELRRELNDKACPLPSSSLYAIAALEGGWQYVNFTPSVGSDLPAIRELAELQKVCHCGADGKTGETFLKSVLAPAFAQRNLEVMSWVGHNIFGNMDGVVLNDPVNKQTKVASKDKLLGEILGYQPQTHVSIEYIQSLGDWKTAWDHIHFRGFLGTPMIMTFTWQGCDSILAAPLVLDLFRFTELASRTGESGVLDWLASFFKSPMGSGQQDFAGQFQRLVDWGAKQQQRS